MHGIVALLGNQYGKIVKDIWQELNQECGLTGFGKLPRLG